MWNDVQGIFLRGKKVSIRIIEMVILALLFQGNRNETQQNETIASSVRVATSFRDVQIRVDPVVGKMWERSRRGLGNVLMRINLNMSNS